MERSRNEAWRRALERTAPIGRDPHRTLPTIVLEQAERLKGRPALLSREETLSYEGLGGRIDRYTRWAFAQQLQHGDVVCLILPNCPDYVAIWLGLIRVGCIVSLVNTNLRGASLEQAIGLVSPQHVIVSAALSEAYESVASPSASGRCFWAHGGELADLPRIDLDTPCAPPLSPETLTARAPSIRDRALYLYTSGTTGLPKAVPISHARLMQWSLWFAGMIGVEPDDRMYNCLPMYHSVGGIVANGALLVGGGSVVVRERFSASRFWADIVEWDCTLLQYIGELCRYLVNTPPEAVPDQHRIRIACGNGLRREVWELFQQRFAIPQILEFYAATEGNISLYNVEGRAGSIGRIPPFLAHSFPIALVRFDVETGRPLRGENGHCARCEIDEAGEAIGRIPDDKASLTGQFEGYLDPVASEAKILRNVFEPGDAWYRTGDLMRRDKAGFYYFVDRIGDTFRWKGENVSTEEVAEAVAACEGVVAAAVYGVAVPDHDGRAGMAAIVVDDGFDLGVFHAALAERLPSYARPQFLRLCPAIEVTGTFKLQKQQLASEGYDVETVSDPLYISDRVSSFVRLDVSGHAAIQRGDVRL